MSALVPLGNRLYHVADVDRNDVRRVISMRDANRKEVEKICEKQLRPGLAEP
jgi:uncharacterized DUF497 family protein